MTEQDVTDPATTTRMLTVRLLSGEELHMHSARRGLASLHGELADDELVLLDEDTIVRSSQIAFARLHDDRGSSGGRVGAVKPRFRGGDAMSTFETERGGPMHTATRGYQPPGLFDQRRMGIETKPFFLTSEFLTLVGVITGLAIAMGVLDNFDANRGWLLITVVAAAYMISRGIAKAGARSHSVDPREQLSWGDGER